MFKPKTLEEAISLARMRDEQLLRQKKAIRPSYQTSFLSPTTSKPSTPIKRLSWEEMQNRRAKGLCFNCDEKFVPGHGCTKPQLLLLDGGFDIDDDDEDGEPEISLHALIGWSSSGTMRVVIQIKSLELICLIDSGSTHNFINEKVAGSLKLLVEPTRPFNVKVTNGDPLQCSGKFRNTPALLQGIPFSITFYSLPIMGLDVVLGVQWLRLQSPQRSDNPDRFPIPTVEDMLDELHGAAYFTKLDFIAGFHQVRVHPADGSQSKL
ncbi:hypothetical protein GH714_007361 [Hevea brasiliensis]|uniref:Reverse transcriptase domain-containing protein n=1 Tax=Hevea brasiliensis TaxID=3981 RepID=A0A6A6MCK5_HEVBR|nr:hypothetical protein GH714_007361 [Hevea brasiliensis]